MRILFVAPHLSTGGLPQYLCKKIECLNSLHEIYCIEYSNLSNSFIVQREKVQKLLGDRYFILGENKSELLNLIEKISPEIVSLEEIPEYFLPNALSEKIYSKNRKYSIIETTHDSSFDIQKKIFLPDKFFAISKFILEKFSPLGVPCELMEYPIEYKNNIDKAAAKEKLGLDSSKKHVINVGLFTSRKNQKEIVEYARKMQDHPIQFHFIGNQADNFKWYWEPLMKDFPPNCKWWGERNDVEKFYEAADLFLFTSRGSDNDKETSPLVIREAISHHLPSLIYNLPVYLNMYDSYDEINYLDFDNLEKNQEKILKVLNLNSDMNKKNVADYFDIYFHKEENKITLNYKKDEPFCAKVVVKDKDSNAPIYWFNSSFIKNSTVWAIPIPKHAYDFWSEPSFGSFLIEFYDEKDELIFSKDIFLKNSSVTKDVKLDLKNPFDCLFVNYNEMFVDKKYESFNLDNLDTALDIGANNGLFSLYLLNKGCKQIYAFEPNQNSLVNLRNLSEKNQKIKTIEKAVYTSDKDLEFYIDSTNSTIGSIHNNIGANTNKIVVPATSLKTFIKDHEIRNLSLVKMDIEGAEYEVIDKLEDEIFGMIDKFLIEFHDNENNGKVEKLISKLKDKGFDITQIRDFGLKSGEDDLSLNYASVNHGTLLAQKSPKDKLLTVIIPTYNHEKYIEECINSVLAQKTLFNFNILISDDSSTDKTFETINKYRHIPNVKIHKTDKNEGATGCVRLTNLLKMVKSDYATIIDGDDYYINQNKLQKQIKFLENNPEYSIHSTGYYQLEIGMDKIPNYSLHSLKPELSLEENLELNYVSFGYMFRNYLIRDKSFPSWFFEEKIFDAYWALGNLLLQYGKAKNESWESGVYRMLSGSAYAGKTESWRIEKMQGQREVLKNFYLDSASNLKKNFAIHLHLFLSSKAIEETSYNNIKDLKSSGFKIIVSSPHELPSRFYDYIDIFYHDKENQLLKLQYEDSERFYLFHKTNEVSIHYNLEYIQNYGLAVIRGMIKGCHLAKMHDIKYIIKCDYDDLFGPESREAIKKLCLDINTKDYDFYAFKSDNYDRKPDVTLHFLLYNCEKFLELFNDLKNEEMYNEYLKKINLEKKCISLESFVFFCLDYSRNIYNIKFDTGENLFKLLPDTKFNTHLSPPQEAKNGILSDIFIAHENGVRSNNKIGLGLWNLASEIDVNVCYDLFYNDALLNTFSINSETHIINKHMLIDIGNANFVKIRNGESDYHKIIEIEKSLNNLFFKKDGIRISGDRESLLYVTK